MSCMKERRLWILGIACTDSHSAPPAKWVIQASDKAQLRTLGDTAEDYLSRMASHLDQPDIESEDEDPDLEPATIIPLTAALRRRLGMTVRTKEDTIFTTFAARTLNPASGSLETQDFQMSNRLLVSFSCNSISNRVNHS